MKYIVYKTKDGKYGVKKQGGKRAIKVFDTYLEALIYAKSLADKNNGEVVDEAMKKTVEKKVKKAVKKNKGLRIFLIILAVILILAIGAYFGYSYYNKTGIFDPDRNSSSSSSSSSNSNATEGVVYDDFQIHFIQLGNNKNGDAIYIKAGDNDILIDAGVSDTSTIKAYMNNYIADNKLEYVIVTHGDSDHIEGFAGTNKEPGIFASYKVDNVIDSISSKTTATYNSYKTARDNSGANHYLASDCFDEKNGAKRVYNLTDNISMEILWNYYYWNTDKSDENNNSVITRFKYNDHYFLLTGDLEGNGEKKFTEYYSNKDFPTVDLYKAAHHGSKTSSTMDFLNLIQPKMCVVSCSAGNPEYTSNYLNVFPTQTFVSNISKFTDKVYATSYGMDSEEKPLNGNIIVSTNGEEVGVAASNNLTILKDTEWFNSKIYIDEKNNFTTSKGKKDYFTKDTENVKEVVFRQWN